MPKNHYKHLILQGTASSEFWIGDLTGSLVQYGKERIDTRLLDGNYVISLSSNGPTYLLKLYATTHLSVEDILKLPIVPRPVFKLSERLKLAPLSS